MTDSYEERRQRLAKLQQKARELEKEVKQADRKLETRKLVILGRFLEQLLERGIVDRRVYEDNFDKFLVRNADRALFDYPLLPEEEQPKNKRLKKAKSTASTAPKTDTAFTPNMTRTQTGKQTPEHKVSSGQKPGKKLPEYEQQLADAFEI
ncbi:MAG: hypothetical protein KME30_31385 [Iphinoe sp. HA4291-MV1]|jgi:hypothetical protein|nr:hypothetical protein [Iphinoe sp. HA4291-MV1]